MFPSSLLEEMASVGPVRLQNVYEVVGRTLIGELYSQTLKKIFLVFDRGHKNATFHMLKKKPDWPKNANKFSLSLKAHAVNKWFNFVFPKNEKNIAGLGLYCAKEDLLIWFKLSSPPNCFFFKDNKLLLGLSQKSDFAIPPFESRQEGVFKGLDINRCEGERYWETLFQEEKKKAFNRHLSLMKKSLKKDQRLLENLSQDLGRCKRKMSLQDDALLLRDNLHNLKKGMSHVELFDYTKDPPAKRKINIDITCPPKDFVARMFKDIKRARRGQQLIKEKQATTLLQIERKKKEIEEYERLGPLGIGSEEIKRDYEIPVIKNVVRKKLPFRTYIAQDGTKILVGRSAKDSDDLTLHHARGNHWWFHARDVVGAHVIVRSDEKVLPFQTLMEAALLAAYFSKRQGEHFCTVSYTQVKHLRKPKGLPPGKVLIAKEKTIEVKVTESHLQRILATKVV